MSRLRFVAIALALVVAVPPAAQADVKTKEKTQMKLGGMLGRMAGLFGGSAARNGVESIVAVKGNRKMSITGDTGELIDLDEQKVYHLDMKGKSYTVVTFAEMKRQMEEARAKAEQQMREARQQQAPEAEPSGSPEREVDIDFDLQDTGQRKRVNGYDCREVLMTVTVREKGKTIEEAGGMVMATSMWMAPKIAALDEVAQFDVRYAKAMFGDMVLPSREQMTQAMAMYPMMQQAMERFEAENVNMEGTALLTEMKFDAVASGQQTEQAEAEEPPRRGGLGGLMGGLAGRMGRRNQNDEQNAGRATVMTTTVEYTDIQSSASDADVSIPAGFREK